MQVPSISYKVPTVFLYNIYIFEPISMELDTFIIPNLFFMYTKQSMPYIALGHITVLEHARGSNVV